MKESERLQEKLLQLTSKINKLSEEYERIQELYVQALRNENITG